MKTRTVQRSRLVPHEVDGRTELVLDRYDVEIPVPPRDWDHIVLTAVTGAAALLVTVSVVWSTTSIGDLLARVVHPAAAYSAAIVFDLLWIMCMALEWLARYDTAKARAPRHAGHAALALAMAAVAAHGWIAHQFVIGLVGAAVSGIAKYGWTAVMRHHAKHLDPLTQQWVDKQRARAGGELAMVSVRRELARTRSAVDAEQRALRSAGDDSPETPEPPPENRAETPEETPTAPESAPALPATGPMTMADAVRTALSCGISTPDAVIRYVRQVADANAKEDSILRTLRTLRRAAG
ncbi:protein transporter Sec31 [Streptomyces jumonjinensis]|uniref:protein transporter Sec31 n=1 Tax=Streptomyces jumonjinensis TaxID=1945 RepID=UPI0037BC576C